MLTSEQLSIINDVRLRTWPYPGCREVAMPTGLWFDEFIKPACDDPSLRVYVADAFYNKEVSRSQMISEHNATIIRGNPWEPTTLGRGILFAVRRGEIPVSPVFKTRWTAGNKKQVSIKVDDPSRVVAEGLTLWYDSWPNITRELLGRRIIRPTTALQMLLGTNLSAAYVNTP